MRLKQIVKIFLLAGFTILSGRVYAQKKWPGVVLYNIDKNEITKKFIVDPVVRILKGEFSYPVPIPPDSWDKPNANKILTGYFDRFCKEEYPKGKKLDLFIDGTKCGAVKITDLDTVNSCSPVVSEVNPMFFDSSAYSLMEHGLVISSLPQQKKIQKFTVDSVSKQNIEEYGKAEFMRRGVSPDIAAKLDIKDIRAVDLDGDGKPEYLVNYFIIGEEAKYGEIESNIQYSLTVILETSGTGYKQAYSHYPDPTVPENTHVYKFIDILDLDGDGICEVIIQNIVSMTRWDYLVLKKKGDTWEQVYEGAGGGC